jgi:hypothetical protein
MTTVDLPFHLRIDFVSPTATTFRSLPTVFCGAEFFLPRLQTDAICPLCYGDRKPESVSITEFYGNALFQNL